MAVRKKVESSALAPVSNDAEQAILSAAPYMVLIRIEGTTPILFHRYSVEAVKAKEAAAKGSKTKKSDDLESYVWRNEDGVLCLPVEYVRQSIIWAAKYQQDPRSSRKSAMDLFKAGLLGEDELATLGTKTWDYVDQRRVVVNRGAVPRERPAIHAGWQAEFRLTVLLPEYISTALLQHVLTNAGRLVGVADNRPTYGRFAVTKFEVQDLT